MTADEFKATRERLKLTRTAMATRLGVTVRTVQRWESGDRKVSPVVVVALKGMRGRKGGTHRE